MFKLLNPWVLGALVFLLALSFSSGWYMKGKIEDAEKFAVLSKLNDEYNEQVKLEVKEALRVEKKLTKQKTKTITITKEIIKYVTTKKDNPICFDAAAVRLWNSSSKGETASISN